MGTKSPIRREFEEPRITPKPITIPQPSPTSPVVPDKVSDPDRVPVPVSHDLMTIINHYLGG